MTHVRRLAVVATLLALAALFTSTAVRGGPGRGERKDGLERPKVDLEDNIAQSKFADRPVVAYVNREGNLLVGWQVKPTLAPSGRAKLTLVPSR